jgi:glutamyl-Q tRNA(Asp) synthetase
LARPAANHRQEAMAASPPVFRFAPSPNGRLHLGHALSALENERLAARFGGRLLLRIEDIDPGRCRPDYEQGVRDDLAWLGIAFDGAVRRQSEHLDDYRAALERLAALGLIYPCFCSRQEVKAAIVACEGDGRLWSRDPDGAPLYPGTCRTIAPDEAAARIAAGAPHVLRLAMDRALGAASTMPGGPLGWRIFDDAGGLAAVAADPARWGDVVLARREVPTSYHLSVVVDDALQGVSHVVRGRDLEAATDIHVLLQRLLGLPTPLYRFHPLLTDEAGRKLAKSRGSRSLAELRAEGATPAALRARLGFT